MRLLRKFYGCIEQVDIENLERKTFLDAGQHGKMWAKTIGILKVDVNTW